ncbi:helix-turn-helix transcriptional regulator [Myceligenerans xiligouense]|uniref:DNA-binding NarL/FixJ family response regulator n=1 Tax=Myceligenerans xiligouense TaxID=253184 RepID=A0A3N4YKZ9_9MICO|nr:response regulator transcription factor [Myceligenerans xiligouense]RPF19994.1 DNA-binding NarL/FixJ family response regulator [Myceligenerans xiligouense]
MEAVRSLADTPVVPQSLAIRPVREPAVRQERAIEVGLEGECPIIKSGLHQVLREHGITVTGSRRPGRGGVVVLVHRGDEALRDIRGYVEAGCVVLAAQPGPTSGFEVSALVAGYHGVIDCQGPSSEIAVSIRAALTGRVVLSEAVARRLAGRARSDQGPGDLTEAEARWLVGLARGTSVVDLATAEAYSERAMYRRLSDLYRKMGVRTRGEAIAVASRHGLI